PLAGLSADDLLRVLGHEIGNLVTIVSGYGQMLRDHWDFLEDARRLDIVARMNRQIDQLRVLIDNFQHLRRLTVGTWDLAALAPPGSRPTCATVSSKSSCASRTAASALASACSSPAPSWRPWAVASGRGRAPMVGRA